MINTNTLLRQVLIASTSTDLYGRVATRIYLDRLPNTQVKSTSDSMVFTMLGGESFVDADMFKRQYELVCFPGVGSTVGELTAAESVWGAAFDLLQGLQGMTVTEGVLVSAIEQSPGTPVWDEATERPAVVGTFELEMRSA